MPSSACPGPHPAPPPFPTRRSSDLRRFAARARRGAHADRRRGCRGPEEPAAPARHRAHRGARACRVGRAARGTLRDGDGRGSREDHRSEEHTSELQSPCNLVCRLLLAPAPTLLPLLSLHDALPIFADSRRELDAARTRTGDADVEGLKSRLHQRDTALTEARERVESAEQRAERFATETAEALAKITDRKSTRLNSSHLVISYAVFCLPRPPPCSPSFPYTTLFRSSPIRGASSTRRARGPATRMSRA